MQQNDKRMLSIQPTLAIAPTLKVVGSVLDRDGCTHSQAARSRTGVKLPLPILQRSISHFQPFLSACYLSAIIRAYSWLLHVYAHIYLYIYAHVHKCLSVCISMNRSSLPN